MHSSQIANKSRLCPLRLFTRHCHASFQFCDPCDRFLFSLQSFDTRSHHAHFIFINRDVETCRRVFGTTERNTTHGINLEWQKVANEAFEELGYDARIQVRDRYELEADTDNAREGYVPGTQGRWASDRAIRRMDA